MGHEPTYWRDQAVPIVVILLIGGVTVAVTLGLVVAFNENRLGDRLLDLIAPIAAVAIATWGFLRESKVRKQDLQRRRQDEQTGRRRAAIVNAQRVVYTHEFNQAIAGNTRGVFRVTNASSEPLIYLSVIAGQLHNRPVSWVRDTAGDVPLILQGATVSVHGTWSPPIPPNTLEQEAKLEMRWRDSDGNTFLTDNGALTIFTPGGQEIAVNDPVAIGNWIHGR